MGSMKDSYTILVFVGEDGGEDELVRCVERLLDGEGKMKGKWTVVRMKNEEVTVLGKTGSEDGTQKWPGSPPLENTLINTNSNLLST